VPRVIDKPRPGHAVGAGLRGEDENRRSHRLTLARPNSDDEPRAILCVNWPDCSWVHKMDLAELFSHYGYLMLLVGSLGEGMPIMLFGGFAAHRGWLALVPWVILIGAIGNAVAQGIWFFAARAAGQRILEKRVDWATNVERVDRLLKKWEAPVVIGARFIPGFSSAAVVTVALSKISSAKFLVLNAIGAFAWASTFGVLGYALGPAVETVLGDIRRYEKPVAVMLLVAAIIWMGWHHAQTFRSARRKPM
jgi:membrane protein DedA with SNARE-associated domain